MPGQNVYQSYQAAQHQGRVGGPLFPRHQLVWIAGHYGKVGLNADITPASADDTNDGATAAELDTMNMTDKEFELLGGAAASANVTYNAEGGLTFTTAGADGNGMFLLPHLNATLSGWTGVTWGTDQQTRWQCRIRTGTAAQILNCIIWAGLKLTNTDVVITDANQAFFRYEDDVTGGRWVAVSSNAGVDVSADTGLAVTAATDYLLTIDIDGMRRARFFINGILMETTAPLANAIDFIPYICVEADGAAAAKVLHVRGQAISRVFA